MQRHVHACTQPTMASGLPAVETPAHDLEEVVAKQPVVVAWQHLSVYAK